ncbi:hypothetical protein PHPALM_30651 [Phytophthora palmivora]|uniref:Peptidase A2 domain-containing protein n=1 Tax=Phytophthora palmivora TaxID=4796 RepID=A0A2P4X4L4_9STRA|nr:hypothetical protein PHPALM_30651 [Phytophthora palmivora]
MPTYHGHPHESVDVFIIRAKLFMQGKCIDFTNPQNGPRVVAMLAANFRDGAASWYHAKQSRLRAELRKCKQRGSVDDYVKDFRRLMAQIHGMHALDRVDHFGEGLKSETKKEVMYLRCSTLAEAIATAQAYERTHFGSDRSRHPTNLLSGRGTVAPRTPDGPTPMDISAMDSRQIDKNTCRERNLCFYCKENGHRIASCPRKWCGSADVSGVSVEPATQKSPLSTEPSSIEIMELSTVSAGPSIPFIKTVYIADKPFRMLIDSGASHCILKDGSLNTSQMPVIQVSARGFDGGAQQRLVPTCELTINCDSVVSCVPFIFWPMTYEYDGILGRPWLGQCNPVIDWTNHTIAFPSTGSVTDAPLVHSEK